MKTDFDELVEGIYKTVTLPTVGLPVTFRRIGSMEMIEAGEDIPVAYLDLLGKKDEEEEEGEEKTPDFIERFRNTQAGIKWMKKLLMMACTKPRLIKDDAEVECNGELRFSSFEAAVEDDIWWLYEQVEEFCGVKQKREAVAKFRAGTDAEDTGQDG